MKLRKLLALAMAAVLAVLIVTQRKRNRAERRWTSESFQKGRNQR